MNAKEFTDGGLVSTTTFWEVSIPVMVASIIFPIVFSGLLIRLATQALRSGYKLLLQDRDSIEFGILLALNVASAVRGGVVLFWTLWTANFLYVLEFLPHVPTGIAAARRFLQSYNRARAARRYRSQPGTQMPAMAITATASQTGGNLSEVDIVVPTMSSEQDNNVQITTTAEASQGSVHSSTSTPTVTSESRSTVTQRRSYRLIFTDFFNIYLAGSNLLIGWGALAFGAMFLVLDIVYHPKSRSSLSFYHSFALWSSLLGRIYGLFGFERYSIFLWWYSKRQDKLWYRLANRLLSDERSESNEPGSSGSSRDGSNRASAV